MIMPTPARVMVMLEPPALISGKAFPAKGKRFTITPILMTASTIIQSVIPDASNLPRMSGAFWAINKPLHNKVI